MRKFSQGVTVFVFIAATLAIAGVIYEGLTLQWYPIVGLFIIIMDYSFLASVLINIFIERTSKWIKVHLFSLILLMIAIVMKLAGIDYPPISLVFWYLYIWITYGIRTLSVLRNRDISSS